MYCLFIETFEEPKKSVKSVVLINLKNRDQIVYANLRKPHFFLKEGSEIKNRTIRSPKKSYKFINSGGKKASGISRLSDDSRRDLLR